MTINTWTAHPRRLLAAVRHPDGTTVEVFAPPSSRRPTPPPAAPPRIYQLDGCQVIDLASRRERAA